MRPLISIIVPLYNYEQYINDCIMSCMMQTYPNIETIVVDDCSTDRSYDIAKAYPIRLLRSEKNSGYSHCKNLGIRAAKGEFIVHLDADDMLTQNSVEARYAYFEKNPKVDMVHARAYRWRWDGQKWGPDGYNKKAVIHAQTVMLRRSVFERFGLYYEKLRSKADKEMWYRLGAHRDTPLPKLIKVKKLDEFVALYRKHDTQMHKLRKKNKSVNDDINKAFDKRIRQLKREGVTRKNTEFL